MEQCCRVSLTWASELVGKLLIRSSARRRPLLYVNHTVYPCSANTLTSSAPTPLEPPVIKTVFRDEVIRASRAGRSVVAKLEDLDQWLVMDLSARQFRHSLAVLQRGRSLHVEVCLRVGRKSAFLR